MDRKAWLGFVGVLALLAGGVWGALAWSDAAEQARVRERSEARQRAADARAEDLVRETQPLVPDILRGVALGMALDAVRAARGAAMVPARERDPGLLFFEEHLSNGGQAMYGFEPRSRRLVQLQLLSLLPTVEAIAPHLAAMHEQYGTPTGIWDCPSTGGVPTRRFTWRGSHATVSDVFLLYANRVSLTLYLATSEQIGRSLAMGGCQPVPTERIAEFPTATAEQIQAAQGGR